MARVGRLVKEWQIKELSDRIAERQNFFITNITRLPAPEADSLRQKLYASQAHLVMIRQTLGRRAIEPLKISGLTDQLSGSIGLVLSETDALPVAKLLVEFIKSHDQQVGLRAAVIDGQLLDKGRVEELAELPPKPVLLAHVVGTIESPLADLIFTIERLIGDLNWVIEQAAAKPPAQPEEKKEEPPA